MQRQGLACRLDTAPPVCWEALHAAADEVKAARLAYSNAEVMVEIVKPEELPALLQGAPGGQVGIFPPSQP